MNIQTLCVIGAGTMGTGIAQIAAQIGVSVRLLDTAEAALAKSQARLSKSLQGGVERGKLTAEQAEQVASLVTWENNYASVSSADWVIEAVIEDFETKRAVLREISALARADAPIATNTSTLLIRDLAASCAHPERFLGMHFFNPPPAMKLVEIIPGELTRPGITEAAVAFCERMGKTPLVSPDIPGFVVNRALAVLVAAAVDIRAKRGSAEVIDQAIELGLGHKMGPLRTADLVGLDVMLAIYKSLHAQTADPRFAAPEELVRLVEGGKLGCKTGEGFYTY